MIRTIALRRTMSMVASMVASMLASGATLPTLAWLARADAAPASHPPMRPLPLASDRPAATGRVLHVGPAGDDGDDGSAKKPWKTIATAVKRLAPGDTLYLHGGTYFESVAIAQAGTAKAPITIRSAPGELAIIDAGVREFEVTPSTAWEPVTGGAPGEFRSVHEVTAVLTDEPAAPPSGPASTASVQAGSVEFAASDQEGAGRQQVRVLGNFADSMVPLHGYRNDVDLRSDNPYWTLTDNMKPGGGIYLGPGLWYDWPAHRVHVRLAHTRAQPDNYAGETDPRKLALVIGVHRRALQIDRSAHLRIQDVVLRGSAARTVSIAGSHDVELDGVTIYGGAPALWISATDHLRLVRSAVRGTAAPWSSRASMKYRGDAPYLVIADSKGPQSHDWEIAYDEFTDGHDGLVIDSVKTLRFHHNRIDNFNDDGIYLTLPPRASVPEDVQIYENVMTRVYTLLAFAEGGDRGSRPTPAPVGPGVYLYRNVFDLRGGTYTWIAKSAGTAATISPSRLCGDHGSPTWEPLLFYHNTVLTAGPAFRDNYGAGMALGTKGTRRRVFNNIFLQVDGNPGLAVPAPGDDLQADGNLFWSLHAGPGAAGKPRPAAAAGLGANDVFADPRLAHVDSDPAIDVRPLGGGAVDAGVKLSADWPDSLRAADKGKPDIGALPLGVPMLRVGPEAFPKR